MKLQIAIMALCIFLLHSISCSTTGVNNTDNYIVNAIMCPLEGDGSNLIFTTEVAEMINNSGYFKAAIDASKPTKTLFNLWTNGDYKGVDKKAAAWLKETDAKILFYGRHIGYHTFYLGFLLRSYNYPATASIIQIEAYSYSHQGNPTPGLENKLKRIWKYIK